LGLLGRAGLLGIADEQLRRIVDAAGRLSEWPQSGRRRDSIILGMRSIVVSPYVLFYRLTEDQVQDRPRFVRPSGHRCSLCRRDMTEILFYHLQGQKLEGVLPALLEKSLERGWTVVVQSASEERIDALDAQLWTYRDDGFLPHGTWREPDAAAQPVLLTVNGGNPNAATVRFLIDGAPMPADAAAYSRIVLMFNGEDDEAVAAARGQWSDAKAKGFEATYWQSDEQGRWVKKA
jgi:DNA polymerase-3 subunit chi